MKDRSGNVMLHYNNFISLSILIVFASALDEYKKLASYSPTLCRVSILFERWFDSQTEELFPELLLILYPIIFIIVYTTLKHSTSDRSND